MKLFALFLWVYFLMIVFILNYMELKLLSKDWLLKKETKVYEHFYQEWFIFLPAFYLIIWLMVSPKNFGKMSILKCDSWFPSEVSKDTLVRNKSNWNIDSWKQNMSFEYFMAQRMIKTWCRYHTDYI